MRATARRRRPRSAQSPASPITRTSGSKRDPGLGLDPPLDHVDQRLDIGRRRARLRDDEVGVLAGDAGAADARSLEARGIDQRGRVTARRVREDAPTVRLRDRLRLAAPADGPRPSPRGCASGRPGADAGTRRSPRRRHRGRCGGSRTRPSAAGIVVRVRRRATRRLRPSRRRRSVDRRARPRSSAPRRRGWPGSPRRTTAPPARGAARRPPAPAAASPRRPQDIAVARRPAEAAPESQHEAGEAGVGDEDVGSLPQDDEGDAGLGRSRRPPRPDPARPRARGTGRRPRRSETSSTTPSGTPRGADRRSSTARARAPRRDRRSSTHLGDPVADGVAEHPHVAAPHRHDEVAVGDLLGEERDDVPAVRQIHGARLAAPRARRHPRPAARSRRGSAAAPRRRCP